MVLFRHNRIINKTRASSITRVTLLFGITLFSTMFTRVVKIVNDFKTVLPDFNNSSVHPQISLLPWSWKETLHFYVIGPSWPARTNCGGCLVLEELVSSIASRNIGVTPVTGCPANAQLESVLAANVSLVFVYPEGRGQACKGAGNRVHARWILAPLGKVQHVQGYKAWGMDDLVFNFASSTAVHPDLLPRSNILQVITNPKPGDDYDLSPGEIFNKTDRRGTAWMQRKAKKWHAEIEYIHLLLPPPHIEVYSPNAKDFLEVQFFVSYDPYTFFSYCAAMAGAISIVYPLSGVSKSEWEKGTYVGEYLKEVGGSVPGIAYGVTEDEIKYAINTMPKTREFMSNVRSWANETTVERFIQDCYRYSQGERKNFVSAILVKDAYTKWYDEHGNLTNQTSY